MPENAAASSRPNPPIIVIFGITGDLSQRYLLPALYHLIKDGLLDEQAEIIGISRRDVTTDQLFEKVELCVNEADQVCDPDTLQAMRHRTRMLQMDLDAPEAYQSLRQLLDDIEASKGICMNRLYYLSIPPQVYRPIITQMGVAGLNDSCQHGQAATRLLVEKPFGHDLRSAEELIRETGTVFTEEQVFRIDHFLAKPMVQKILAWRVSQPDLEAIWNHDHIASINISAAEQITIEGRANFYEPMGALRDFTQNHLLQLLAIITMDRPPEPSSDQIHTAKQAVLRQVQPISADQVATHTVRGQYRGYREEVGNPDSTTETYAAITVQIDSARWQGVPIRLWTGKALAAKNYEIQVNFISGSRLYLHIQPHEGLQLESNDANTDPERQIQTAVEAFSRQSSPTPTDHLAPQPDAYEQVLTSAIAGDHTLFATSAEILASWQVIQPVLEAWAKTATDLIIYKPGSTGPLNRPGDQA